MLSCPRCARANPADALFCFHDGIPLRSVETSSAWYCQFAQPLVLPSGRLCRSFDELILTCLEDWPLALQLFRDGTLIAHLTTLGRSDLAQQARQAARFPDIERGLDTLLRQLPTSILQPARQAVHPCLLDLGRRRVGQDTLAFVRVVNEGMGLLYGTVTSDVPWLSVHEGEGNTSRLFRCLHDTTLTVRMHGKALRAASQPQFGRLTFASSGGVSVVTVRVEVPPSTFASGILAGARSPRQLADKARAHPREAARLFESGAVARWYLENGWSYPVEGEPATGIAAVQQYFDALGLATAPRLHLSEKSITLQGHPGQSLQHTLKLFTTENRPVYARPSSDQSWLVIRGVDLDGPRAEIHLAVPQVPEVDQPTLRASLTLLANARQSFVVPVTLHLLANDQSTACLETPSAQPAHASANLPEWVPSQPPIPAEPPPVPFSRRRRSRIWLLGSGIMLLLLGGLGGLLTLRVLLPSLQQTEPISIEDPCLTEQPLHKEHPRTLAILPPPSRSDAGSILRRDPFQLVDIRPHSSTDSREPVLLIPEFQTRQIEVVFCLDTTGSMGKLLDGVRSKIWSMCNQIASGNPTPQLRVGLVAYRDRGDEYVTRRTALTRDLDVVHAELHELHAQGGGDQPESVNQALHEAVHLMPWSEDRRTLKIIFLVGDAPPHMDYNDEVKYPESCRLALDKGILLNTIQCGRDADCTRIWKDIAARGKGGFVAIPQSGGVITIPSRFDDALTALGRKLLDTVLLFGTEEQRQRAEQSVARARRLTGPPAADRTAFVARSKRLGPYDLLDALHLRKVKLEELPLDQLPAPLREKASHEERLAYLQQLEQKRAKLFDQVLELEQQRSLLLAEERKRRSGGKDSFDSRVLDLLRQQARAFEIDYR